MTEVEKLRTLLRPFAEEGRVWRELEPNGATRIAISVLAADAKAVVTHAGKLTIADLWLAANELYPVGVAEDSEAEAASPLSHPSSSH